MEHHISAFDRLFFALILALALFVLLIFGISFDFPTFKENHSKALEVTLAQHDSVQENTEADFLADANQQGSGDASEIKELMTTEQSEFEDSRIHQVNRFKPVVHLQFAPKQQIKVLSSDNDSTLQVETKQTSKHMQPAAKQDIAAIEISEINDIATLKAMLANRRQQYAKRPRVRTLTALSTKRAVDATYVNAWLKKIERIGNKNYPQLARERGIFGDVRVVVSILASGKLKSAEIVSSSGHRILDDSAKQIIALSSPFAPFPLELANDTDIIEIIRTWRFEPGDQLTTSPL